jgi:membrane peptidoglycan carboxypeptidase
MTAAFAAFANGGLVSRPFLIRRVLDRDGTVLVDLDEPAQRAIAPQNAYRMADMLADVIDFGTGSGARRLGFDLPAGGKTGTTNDYRDAWFIGFTPTLVAGVWVGYDQPRMIRPRGYASDLAVPLWTQFMKSATRGDARRWLEEPLGLDDERLRGGVLADGQERAPKQRGFWARLFGIRDDRRRQDDRGERAVIVDGDERYRRGRDDREKDEKEKRRDQERRREEKHKR